MSNAETLVLAAMKWIGLKEDPVGYNSQIKKWIEKSCTSLKIPFPKDDSEFAWCACFISNLLIEEGIWRPDNLHIVAARKFLTIGEVVLEPQIGDLVILERGFGKGHIGIYLNQIGLTGRLRMINGNSSDSVTIADFDKSRVLGYRRI